MNDMLQPVLRRFVLVFFDDILIYISSWTEHMRHVRLVMDALRANHLQVQVPFRQALGLLPEPRSARGVRGFLVLAGYYRKCIRDFGAIAAPLTPAQLLHKEGLAWTPEASTVFAALKQALTTRPVFQMPDFERRFIIDCDASGTGFDVVLH